MEEAYIIPDAQAHWLMNQKTLDRDARGLLKTWAFHKHPPEMLLIQVDEDYEYALSDYGDRLGLVSYWEYPPGELWFWGDNGKSYYGKRTDHPSRRVFRVHQKDYMQTIEQRILDAGIDTSNFC